MDKDSKYNKYWKTLVDKWNELEGIKLGFVYEIHTPLERPQEPGSSIVSSGCDTLTELILVIYIKESHRHIFKETHVFDDNKKWTMVEERNFFKQCKDQLLIYGVAGCLKSTEDLDKIIKP